MEWAPLRRLRGQCISAATQRGPANSGNALAIRHRRRKFQPHVGL